MLHFNQSSRPETNGHHARGFACRHCPSTTYRIDQDGDMSCTACGRLLLFGTKAVNGAPSLERNTYLGKSLGAMSPRRHEVKYRGNNPAFNDTTIEAVLRKPKTIKPKFEIGCPYCSETVIVPFIAPVIAGVERWRLRCSNDHVVFVAPAGDGVPARWWA